MRQVWQLLRLDLEQIFCLQHIHAASYCATSSRVPHSYNVVLMLKCTSASMASSTASWSFRSLPAAMSCSLAEASNFPCRLGHYLVQDRGRLQHHW